MPKFNAPPISRLYGRCRCFAAAPVSFRLPSLKKVDLVIVGGGLARRAAANAAVKKSVKPIVLEKAFLGGAGCSRRVARRRRNAYQKEHGIKTTVQRVLDWRLCSSTTIAVIRPSFVC